jgi:3alpha(or 20beta)-hydroxysteroid dehydrogenase
MGRVDNKVVLITGGASGQGRAEANTLAAEGASVIVGDISFPDDLEELDIQRLHLDVTSPEDWEAAATVVAERYGHLDGLVNNAGVTFHASLLEVTVADWERVFGVNATGALLGIQAMVPLMPRGSSIVNVCSLAALTGMWVAAYTSSKWALRGLSRVASLELGYLGIRVNTIFPGAVQTPMAAGRSAAFDEALLAEVPLGRIGHPEDFAPLVTFLCSDESSWISGAEISVDGGAWSHGGTKAIYDKVRADRQNAL